MWGFQSKRNALREQLLLQAPEANPSEFVRRYLLQRSGQNNGLRVPRDRAKDGPALFVARSSTQNTRA